MKVKIGVEKECLVFDDELNPIDLDIDNLPTELTVDFANHQLEVVTFPHNSALALSGNINDLLSNSYFEGKQIWPISTPPRVNPNVLHNKLDKEYRDRLALKYGIDKMLYCGIHFNYSNELLNTPEEYFKLIQNVFDYMPIIMQFTSFSPYTHERSGDLEQVGKNFGFADSLSLRASERYGYSNGDSIKLDFQSYERYVKSKDEAITKGGLFDEREIYSRIRLKKDDDSHYIELRFLDLNPYTPAGISDETLVFMESCLNYLSTIDNNQFKYTLAEEQIEQTALHGRNRDTELVIGGCNRSLYDHTLELLDELIARSTINTYTQNLRNLKLKYINKRLDVDVMCTSIESKQLTLAEFALNNVHIKSKFNVLYPELNMELSTKLVMREAERRGYKVEIESESQNIIKVTEGNHSEYIIQATKTNLDKFVNVLLMNDKYMTKKILESHEINVPKGIKLTQGDKLDVKLNGEIVIKPLDTNFGLGISICDSRDQEQVVMGCQNAFKYSEEILVEQFATGEEYRFLVIDDKVESIVTRKNANVVGDGKSTLLQLIDQKNQSSLRSRGYKTPLEEIEIDDDLKRVIAAQGYALDSIVELSVKVLLRDTSNVSQGGDSHEVYDLIPEKYKICAVEAAKALDVKICGIDMIIDFNKDQYVIIEANYNPAIHMHMFPYSGRGRDVASKVLDALFKK